MLRYPVLQIDWEKEEQSFAKYWQLYKVTVIVQKKKDCLHKILPAPFSFIR